MAGRPFPKGHPKPPGSGRVKGTPNKARLKRVAEILAEAGMSPAAEIIDCIALMDEPKDRAKAWGDLLSYCEAKPKAVEPDKGGDNSGLDLEGVPSADLLKLVKEQTGGS